MKYFIAIHLALFACHCVSATPFNGLGNGLGKLDGVRRITGTQTKFTGALYLEGIEGNQGFQYNQQVHVKDVKNNQASQRNDGEINVVASKLEEVFDLIIETAESVENTYAVVSSIVAVSDVVYVTVAVMSNVNNKVLSDPNDFCELSAYLEAAIEKILEHVNGVILSVAEIVDYLLEEIDIVILKWVIEAIVLESTVEVASKPNKKLDIKPSLADLTSAFAGIVGTLTQATGSARSGVSGGLSDVDLKATLGGVSNTISSLLNGLALTNINTVVDGLIGSACGSLGGLLKGVTGTISGTLNAVGGVAGCVLTSLNGITGGSTEIFSQLKSQVSGVVRILSDATLSLTQAITVVVTVIRNISTISNRFTGILKSLKSTGNVCGSSFKINAL